MLEFEKTLGELASHLQESHRGYSSGWRQFREAEKTYAALEEIRDQMLQATLKEKGLAVCSGHHYFTHDHESEDWRTKTPEELGIFPADQMKLRYVQGMVLETDHFTMNESEYPIHEVLLLCPRHFEAKYLGLFGRKKFPVVYSEVEQNDGKLVLKTDSRDITSLRDQKTSHNFQNRIELSGNKNPDISVFRYLGIPDLPPRPDLSMVR